jgi:hypothetical protein
MTNEEVTLWENWHHQGIAKTDSMIELCAFKRNISL